MTATLFSFSTVTSVDVSLRILPFTTSRFVRKIVSAVESPSIDVLPEGEVERGPLEQAASGTNPATNRHSRTRLTARLISDLLENMKIKFQSRARSSTR